MLPQERFRIVEIGPLDKPVYARSAEVADQIRAGASYIAIDRFASCLWGLPIKTKAIAELSNLPLPNACVNETWLLNVTNCPGNWARHQPVELPDGKLWNENVYKCLQELARITRPGGKIHIGEFDAGVHENLRLLGDMDYESLGLDSEFFVEKDRIQEFLINTDLVTEQNLLLMNYIHEQEEKKMPYFL